MHTRLLVLIFFCVLFFYMRKICFVFVSVVNRRGARISVNTIIAIIYFLSWNDTILMVRISMLQLAEKIPRLRHRVEANNRIFPAGRRPYVRKRWSRFRFQFCLL
ncbi:unnamed protein product [Ixodes pacificus]